ncbi:MAG: hypothetical protein A2Z21_00375 [Candidatus Fraserbacteria bacterium RBG_16_55_9]|uniref:Uncharacterized protein n=1 Tax=Fraserbacteria sp. (strain RBG_16_55_9) TaxID=1817864 RepID=A0A1F5UVR1_FRAXR|nr:MAG: hypothetical protein A2Z21_00375 [Candidatus Fraserbacteria bacterium RBG_16_55_9]
MIEAIIELSHGMAKDRVRVGVRQVSLWSDPKRQYGGKSMQAEGTRSACGVGSPLPKKGELEFGSPMCSSELSLHPQELQAAACGDHSLPPFDVS